MNTHQISFTIITILFTLISVQTAIALEVNGSTSDRIRSYWNTKHNCGSASIIKS